MVEAYFIRISYLKINIVSIIVLLIAFPLSFQAAEYPIIWNVSYHNKNFEGREIILKEINKLFNNGEEIVSLVGLGGIGKTQIAKKYAEEYRTRYDIIWWIDASKDIDIQYIKLAEFWNAYVNKKENYIDLVNLSTKSIVNQVINNLRTTNLNYLIIFDNTIKSEDIIDYLPTNHSNKHANVLITSRNNNMLGKILKVKEFKRYESINLINKLMDGITTNEANSLAEILHDYPLSISQATSYIKLHSTMTIKRYIELFKVNYKILWNEEDKMKNTSGNPIDNTNNYPYSLTTTLNMTIQKIKELSNDAYQLLVFCSLLNNQKIPEEVLFRFNYEGENIAKNLKGHNAISLLEQHSLIDKDKLEGKADKAISTYTIHEMTQKVVLDQISSHDIKAHLSAAVKTIHKFLSDKMDLLVPFIKANPHYLDHTLRLIDLSKQHQLYDNSILELNLRALEYYLPAKRDFKTGEQLLENIEKIKSQIPEVVKVLQVRIMVLKSALLNWAYAKQKESLTIMQEAVTLVEELPEAPEEQLMVYNNISQIYYFLGDLKNAEKYSDLGKQVVDNTKGYLGNQDSFYISRARVYLDKGDLDGAMENSRMSLAKTEETGEEIPLGGKLPALLMQADILAKKGDYREAYEQSNKMLEDANKFFDDKNHVYFGRIKTILAHATFGLGDLKTAKKEVMEAIEIFDKSNNYKNSRPKASALMTLADILIAEGSYSDAQDQLKEAEKIFDSIFTEKQVDDLSRLYTTLAKNSSRLDDGDLAKHYLSLHKKCFGFAHKRNFEIMEFLNQGVLNHYRRLPVGSSST
jgi:tetratricopeptide (TPR) repeat protein